MGAVFYVWEILESVQSFGLNNDKILNHHLNREWFDENKTFVLPLFNPKKPENCKYLKNPRLYVKISRS